MPVPPEYREERPEERPAQAPVSPAAPAAPALETPATGAAPDPARSPARGRAFPRADRAVLEGVRRGDAEALAAFFDLYFDRIYALASRILGNRALAEDAAQDVCYRIQRGAHHLDPERDPGPWITAATVNACRSYWRSAASRLTRVSISLDGDGGESRDLADGAAGPDERLIAREREAAVQQALDELAGPLREVVVLHDYQGLDHKEIASTLGLSHEATRKRYSRALMELGRRLKGRIG